MQQIIEEDVNKYHSSSSEDDQVKDYEFREKSSKLTQLMVDTIEDGQIDDINHKIHINNYEKGLKNWR